MSGPASSGLRCRTLTGSLFTRGASGACTVGRPQRKPLRGRFPENLCKKRRIGWAYNWSRDSKQRSTMMRALLCPDGVRPNDAGHAALADSIKPHLLAALYARDPYCQVAVSGSMPRARALASMMRRNHEARPLRTPS